MLCSTSLLLCSALILMTSLFHHIDSQEYIADIRVYVDFPGLVSLHTMADIKTDDELRQIIHDRIRDVNDNYFKSLRETYHFNINLRLEKVEIVHHNILPEGQVTNLNAFNDFVIQNGKSEEFDIALLFTGSINDKDPFYMTTGLSFMRSVCTDYSIGIIKMDRDEELSLVIAHELGHILGAQHDEQCRHFESGTAMNQYTPKDSPNRFTFSRCAYEGLKWQMYYLNTTWSNCLLQNYYDNIPTVDEVCESKFGKGYTLSRGRYRRSYKYVCYSMQCVTTTMFGRFLHSRPFTAPDGIPCGKNSICMDGHCIYFHRPLNNVSETCPFGDQDLTHWRLGSSCTNIERDGLCSPMRYWCCKTCDRYL